MARAGRAGPHSRAIRPMCRSDPAQHPRLHHLVAVLAGIGAAMARCREIACGKSTNRPASAAARSEEHTSELQSHSDLVCRLLLEKKKITHVDHNDLELHRLVDALADGIRSLLDDLE